MIYLLLNITCSSAFMLCIKWVQQRQREDVITIGVVNYIAAATLIFPQFVSAWSSRPADAALPVAALLLGAVMGVSYFLAFFLVINMVRWVGAAASTVVSVLSIMAPIILGTVIWDEAPNVQQWVGIVLALVALLMIGGHRAAPASDHRPWLTRWILFGFFVLAGVNRVAQDAFRHLCEGDQRPIFLMAAFTMTSIPSLLMLWNRRGRLKASELLIGVGLGLANLLQSLFILKALQVAPGFIVFPVASAGGLILTTLVATRMMHEQLHQRTYLGIMLTTLALALLHWRH